MGAVRNLGNSSAAPVRSAQHQPVAKTNPENPHTPPHKAVANCPGPCPEDLLETITNSLANQQAGEDYSRLLKTEFSPLIAKDSGFIIATLPDPVHTHLSLFFDRTIDAIQQGAQAAGWIFDRATVPWDNKDHPESTDFKIRDAQDDDQEKKENWPGLMIFRQAQPNAQSLNKFLYVFLVGERPTGGINRQQFHATVEIIKAVNNTGPLVILGPTFSGSLYSLEQLIEEQKLYTRFPRIMIRSGTVASWQSIGSFLSYIESLVDSNKKPIADFASLQHSDCYMLKRFLEFEHNRGYEADHIAVLTEDETAYGNKATTINQTCPLQSADGNPKVLQLYFPRDISQLRSVYQEGFDKQGASSGNNEYKVRTTLPLNLQDTGSDDDSVQQFAHTETPLSQESILLGIVATLREQHVQFVVLQATNPMDTLFLSAFLKRGFSEARVVAIPADLLLSRDVDDVSLFHGVMALTTYSLLPDADEKIARPNAAVSLERTNNVFPSANAVGTYNATIALINGINSGTPASTLPTAEYSEYGWPALGGTPQNTSDIPVPPVWVTVLGRNGFWPLAVLGESETTKRDRWVWPIENCVTPSSFSPPIPLISKLLGGIVVALMISFYFLLSQGTIIATSSTMTLLAPVRAPQRSALIITVAWLLVVAALLLLWPWYSWVKFNPWPLIVGILLLAAFWIACWIAFACRGTRTACLAFASGTPFLIVAFVSAGAFDQSPGSPGHSRIAFLYRYIHATSEVSPLLPLLCLLAAALWWAWLSLSGMTLVDRRRPRLPRLTDLPCLNASANAPVIFWRYLSEDFAKSLIRMLYPVTRDRRVFIPLGAVGVVAIFSCDYYHPLLSLETRHFEWIYSLAFMVGIATLLYSLFQLLFVWLELRRMLGSLNRIPLRRAFATLKFSWNPIWRQGGGRLQDLARLISREIETLVHLNREIEYEDEEPAAILKEKIASTIEKYNGLSRQARDKILRPNAPGVSQALIKAFSREQKRIAQTCAAAFAFLQIRWWEEEGVILSEFGSGGKAEGDKEKDASEISVVTGLAERFCALVYLNFILTVVMRMRTLVLTISGMYVFLLLSVDSYPFEPRVALRSGAILMLIFVVGVVGYVAAQLHRDSILSLVTQTTPGELGMEFWLKMASFVALPLLSLLVSQFPSLNNALFSWLEPAMNALK
jgi:hypothetical protein